MDATEYKAMCSRPDTLNRGVLEDTERVLSPALPTLASKLREVLAGRPIPKPMSHDGDAGTDYFRVELSAEDAEEIANASGDAEVGAIAIGGETTPEASRFATLRDMWANYGEFRVAAEI